MSLKNKVGNYLILFGLILLLIFIATVVAPPEAFDTTAFIGAAVLLVVGVNFRRSKVRPRAGGPAGGGGGGAPGEGGIPAAPPKAKRQGLLATMMHGPANKKTAPGAGRPAAGAGGAGGAGGKGGGGKGPAGGGKGGAPAGGKGGGRR